MIILKLKNHFLKKHHTKYFPVFSFNTQKNFIEEIPPKETLKIDENLIFNLNEYKQAMFYSQREKFRISQEFYKRVLVYLENNDSKISDSYVFILKKFNFFV